jgi:hypothetical protein
MAAGAVELFPAAIPDANVVGPDVTISAGEDWSSDRTATV